MARVRSIAADELPADLAAIYREFAGSYGPFANQVAVFAHVPAALRHLMPLLLELRAAKTLPKRTLELAIVAVSQLNACDYCVAHHKPFLAVEGVSAAFHYGRDRSANVGRLNCAVHVNLNAGDCAVILLAFARLQSDHLIGVSVDNDVRIMS